MKDIYEKNILVLRRIYQMTEYINKQDDVRVHWLIKGLAEGVSRCTKTIRYYY